MYRASHTKNQLRSYKGTDIKRIWLKTKTTQQTCSHSDVSSGENQNTNIRIKMDMKHEQRRVQNPRTMITLFERTLGECPSFPLPHRAEGWLKYTYVVFVSGGWVGEQKLRRVVDKPAHPPLARQRCKRLFLGPKGAAVSYSLIYQKENFG